MKDTAKLYKEHAIDVPRPAGQDADVSMGFLRPWRLGLLISHVPVKLVFDLVRPTSIGRYYANSSEPDIDLTPFDADERGVSRLHLLIKLEGESIVIIDNNSTNGTLLNGRPLQPRLPYPVHHGDRLRLGGLDMQIEMLIDPLE